MLAPVLAQIPDPGSGSGSLQHLVGLFTALVGVGFIVAVAGHVVKSRTLVLAGVVLVFAGTACWLVAFAGNA